MSLIISRGPAGGRVQLAFGDYVLDSDRRELRRGSVPIALEPQVFDLLVYLVQNRDRVVSKDDLIATVWRNRIVSDSTLTSRINAARKALRFVGDVQAPPGADHPTQSPAPADDVAEPRTALPLPDRPAIAVLPFIN